MGRRGERSWIRAGRGRRRVGTVPDEAGAGWRSDPRRSPPLTLRQQHQRHGRNRRPSCKHGSPALRRGGAATPGRNAEAGSGGAHRSAPACPPQPGREAARARSRSPRRPSRPGGRRAMPQRARLRCPRPRFAGMSTLSMLPILAPPAKALHRALLRAPAASRAVQVRVAPGGRPCGGPAAREGDPGPAGRSRAAGPAPAGLRHG
jgi:hypothetical protein